jgi:catechol 2,3-dioxygenase-like lactoylglutathione lyase family enzyme
MTRLNHINLAVSDVPQLTRFFEVGFGFRVAEQRGSGKFAVLLGEEGFALILMHDKKVTATTYPALFHVGFLLGSEQDVKQHHARITEAGFEAPAPAILERGGDKTFGFYCHVPGGVIAPAQRDRDQERGESIGSHPCFFGLRVHRAVTARI